MKNLLINKPIRPTETIDNYKYPKYSTYYLNEIGEKIDGPALQVVKRWQNHNKVMYRLQYQTYEILRVFWVGLSENDSLENKVLIKNGIPANYYYARLASD